MTRRGGRVLYDPVDRLGALAVRGQTPESCWGWLGKLTPAGYGVIYAGRRHWTAHRVSYAVHHGPIPFGLVVDHLCRTRSCTNPLHLEAVTLAENTRRAGSHAWRAAHPVPGSDPVLQLELFE